jgi:hypothetical protein
LVVLPNDGGEVITDPLETRELKYGSVVTLEAFPDAGRSFINWSIANLVDTIVLITSNNPLMLQMEKDLIVEVNYTSLAPKYEVILSANPTNYGSVAGAGIYDSGATVSVVATPLSSDYMFIN